MPEILVIDDNLIQLHVRETILREAGFSVAAVSSAAEALQWLKQDEAGGLRVILTDHVMPGASGATFVRELRRINPSVPVFVISGMEEAEQEYADLGVSFVHKPCLPEELIARVRETIQGD